MTTGFSPRQGIPAWNLSTLTQIMVPRFAAHFSGRERARSLQLFSDCLS